MGDREHGGPTCFLSTSEGRELPSGLFARPADTQNMALSQIRIRIKPGKPEILADDCQAETHGAG